MLSIDKEIKLILDENVSIYRPDPQWVKEKGWFCRVYLMGYDRIEANFIEDAVVAVDEIAIEFLVENSIAILLGKENVTVEYIDNFYELDRNIDIGISCAGFTNKDVDYLYLKDAESEIFMLFGEKSFINKVMPISIKEYKKYYEDFFGAWDSIKIDRFLKNILNEYKI